MTKRKWAAQIIDIVLLVVVLKEVYLNLKSFDWLDRNGDCYLEKKRYCMVDKSM